ncbi:hypothetical protein LTR86_010871 [Recurvomyces mirabilis]|nr:hypothetical protein LTR86_010871 [Recurvomyces mirabilis]
MAFEARMTSQHGLAIPGASDLKSDLSLVEKRKALMVDNINGFKDSFDKFNVGIIEGEARFLEPKVIQVSNGRRLTADTIIISTGSRAFIDPSIPGLVESSPMTHIELLDNQVLPSHLIVIGGGYVGLEFAQAYCRFGAKVTVVQRQQQVLVKEDEDVVLALVSILESEGVRFMTNTEVKSVEGKCGDIVTLTVESNGKSTRLQGSHILVSAGRLPNTEDLDLAKAGIETTSSGHVVVNDQLQTVVDGVYASGDCANSPYFTHMGWDDHRVILSHISGHPRRAGTVGRLVPNVLFTSPELAQVGLREKEAKAAGIDYRLVTAPMASTFLRTHTLGTHALGGFVKALVAKDSDKILGFTALGVNAGELLAVITLAMQQDLDYQVIEDLIITHPTLNEGLALLFMSVPPA